MAQEPIPIGHGETQAYELSKKVGVMNKERSELVEKFLRLAGKAKDLSWVGVYLGDEERFVVRQILDDRDISINSATVKALESAVRRQGGHQISIQERARGTL